MLGIYAGAYSNGRGFAQNESWMDTLHQPLDLITMTSTNTGDRLSTTVPAQISICATPQTLLASPKPATTTHPLEWIHHDPTIIYTVVHPTAEAAAKAAAKAPAKAPAVPAAEPIYADIHHGAVPDAAATSAAADSPRPSRHRYRVIVKHPGAPGHPATMRTASGTCGEVRTPLPPRPPTPPPVQSTQKGRICGHVNSADGCVVVSRHAK